MNETLKPMDDIRLRFYYALMSYSIGLISFISIQNPFTVLVLDLLIIIITPLTLLFTDEENIYVEITITIIFPTLTLLLGIFKGYIFIKIYNYYFIKKNTDDNTNIADDDVVKKKSKICNNISQYCKAALIAATTMSICIFYIIDLSVPFLVRFNYPNIYLKIRLFIHLLLSLFLIGLSIGFKQKRFGKLWMMVAYSTTTILMTTLFIFNIITKNGYFVYLVFTIHFTIIVISLPIWIILLYKIGYKIIIKKYLYPYMEKFLQRSFFKKKYENVIDEKGEELDIFNDNTKD
jgi:hypothetical protein